ncbi:MAG: FG-GAP-like repeat-containing protein [Acidobacteriota bacterium]
MDKSRRKGSVILAAIALCVAGQLGAAPRIDFNGDGYADLAVGVPHEDEGRATDAGAVNVIYGSADGLSAHGNVFFTHNTRGVAGIAQKGAQFGKALAAGDFNGDGFTDLAVGAPYFDQPRQRDAGDLVIFYGGRRGLSGSRCSFLYWFNSLRTGSLFGAALAAGDFDSDGFEDIAVGAPDAIRWPENAVGSGRGVVVAWYGSRRGMTRIELWQQGVNGLRETSEYRDQFGSALATGDFNGDGTADLAVGAPGEEGVDWVAFGAVSVIFGRSGTGLVGDGNQVWTQITDGAGNTASAGDRYGSVLGSGDFDGDGCDELVVGAPGDGSVHVIYGRTDGLISESTQEFYAPMPDIAGADFDNNGADDLVLRFQHWYLSGVQVYSGSSDGLQDTPKEIVEYLLPGLNLSDDWQFPTARPGCALATDDFEGRGVFDLAVGVPFYDIPYKHNLLQVTDAGAVAVVRNIAIVEHPDPMSETPIIQWTALLDFFEGNYPRTIHEILGAAEPGDNFGEVFAH